MRWSSLGLVALLASCVSQEELDKALQERDALKSKVTELTDELDNAKGQLKELETELAKSRETKPNRPPGAVVAAAMSELELEKDQKLVARLVTSMGDIDCELWPDKAPNTVLNFVGLAEGKKEYTDPADGLKKKGKFYDGTVFHRVIKGFMVQGGDPEGTGRGGPGFRFGDEVWPDVRFDRPGMLAMANAGPGTNGSQFFITDSKPQHLNMRHTIFGLCEIDVVRKIMDVEVGGPQKSRPVKDIVLKSVEIRRESGESDED